ncbi:MAG: AAA family ATPase [Bacteroidales bacterium]|nr:AAA family ATPase [Bacteroidales bacterium]
MAVDNNLANIVETIASEQKNKYDTEVLLESQFYSDFPYKVLSFLEKHYQDVFQSFMKHIVPDNSGKLDYMIYVFDSIRIPRLFLSVDLYPSLTGKDSTRWITDKTFLIDGKEYYISNQWVGHKTEEKKNLRINDFAMAIYNNSKHLFFVDFVKKSTPKPYAQLVMVKQPKVENNYTHPNDSFMINQVVTSILSTGLIYFPTLIKRLAYSLMAKPFVILSGLAGSGKTQLALAFAKCLSENIEEQVCTVSIGADWTNREPLLGYPNALNKDEYVKPESGVLQLLMRANEDKSKPYFLILDEMNLSVVERYFADFLSAMESGEPIKLWDGNESEEDENKYVPAKIHLPKNVYIIGTINVDETTYMFSPKVLDRANVIEFKIAPDEMDKYLGKKVNINLKAGYSACADMADDFVNKANSQVEKDEKNKDVLLSFFKELKKVNAEFGYRTVNEISRYLHFAEGDLEDDSAIDTAILQKLLPKLHGSRKKLVPTLTALWDICLNNGNTTKIDTETEKLNFQEGFKYPESAEKIKRMYDAVIDNGFTSFAEA